jgi:3-phenylpropionate/trans-cinnamate dioxygenase ferredoxin reductase component
VSAPAASWCDPAGASPAQVRGSACLVASQQAKFQKGVIYYLADNCVRGVLLWNMWGQVEAARELIKSRRQQKLDELIGRLREDK